MGWECFKHEMEGADGLMQMLTLSAACAIDLSAVLIGVKTLPASTIIKFVAFRSLLYNAHP